MRVCPAPKLWEEGEGGLHLGEVGAVGGNQQLEGNNGPSRHLLCGGTGSIALSKLLEFFFVITGSAALFLHKTRSMS